MGLVLPEFDFKPTTSKVKGSLCVPVVLDTRGVYNIILLKTILGYTTPTLSLHT